MSYDAMGHWCDKCAELEADLAVARAEVADLKAQVKRWEEQEIHEAMQCWKDNEQLKADLAAARAEVERKDAILRQLAKDGRLWVDVQDLQAARVRLVYQPEHESEVARLREALRLIHREAGTHTVALHGTPTGFSRIFDVARAALEERPDA